MPDFNESLRYYLARRHDSKRHRSIARLFIRLIRVSREREAIWPL